MENKQFLRADDVAAYMEVSIPMAYKIIRRLNDELVAQGYLTVCGRISRTYFEQKVFGGKIA
ncbi:MAG: LysR family transcriptional regulator [Oscillospiraceae bacterium]